MNKLISKTDYILFRECAHNAWVKKWNYELYNKLPLSAFDEHLMRVGNEVELEARKRFPNGILIENRDAEQTEKLLKEEIETIFQASFSDNELFVAVDILTQSKNGEISLYEVKSSSRSKEKREGNYDHIDNDGDDVVNFRDPKVLDKYKKKLLKDYHLYDLAFQVYLTRKLGYKVTGAYLIRLNKNYVRIGEINLNDLFVVEDVISYVDEILPKVEVEIKNAINTLNDPKEPKGNCLCYYKGRSKHCTTFDLHNKGVPKYGVHDLNRIGKSPKLLRGLLDNEILEISEIPEHTEGLTPKPTKKNPNPKPRKLNQIKVHKSQESIINIEAIRKELGKLQAPFYFLDYETYPAGIPIFNGYKPYQQVVFQYSLHVLKGDNSPIEHYEFIELKKNPAEEISKSLRENIGDTGTIVVWNKTFENHCNKDLAELVPEYKDFFDSIILRTYDLKDIVENQYYVHPKFLGRSSIKFVLPALFGNEMSYKHLEIKSGTDAIEAYDQILKGKILKKDMDNKKEAMLRYCRRDTEAMVKIWKHFKTL